MRKYNFLPMLTFGFSYENKYFLYRIFIIHVFILNQVFKKNSVLLFQWTKKIVKGTYTDSSNKKYFLLVRRHNIYFIFTKSFFFVSSKIFRIYYGMSSRELRYQLNNIVIPMEKDLSDSVQDESLQEETEKKAVKTIYAQLRKVRLFEHSFFKNSSLIQ